MSCEKVYLKEKTKLVQSDISKINKYAVFGCMFLMISKLVRCVELGLGCHTYNITRPE